jgi:hypothetical protein
MSAKLVTFAAVGAVLTAMLVLPAAQALEHPGTVRITDAETGHVHIDMGKAGKSAGDLDVYSQVLYNKRITSKAIGHGKMTCTAVGNTGQSCTAAYFLPQGEIVVQGVINSRLIYELAVIGGTGLYNNVRGSLTVTSLDRKPSKELLVFRLVL